MYSAPVDLCLGITNKCNLSCKHCLNRNFDGSKPEIMDKVRGKGAFQKKIRGIKALLSEGVSVLLSVTLTKINYKDVRGMVLLGKKLKADSIRFNHVFFGGN